MQRREFLTVAGAVAAAYPMRSAEFGMRNRSSTGQFRTPHSAFRISGAQEPSLSPEVFARRLERARIELKARGLDLLIATPGTNYEYLTGYNPGRSERLIALLLPVAGAPAIVCPSFEVERIRRHSVHHRAARLGGAGGSSRPGARHRASAQARIGERNHRPRVVHGVPDLPAPRPC